MFLLIETRHAEAACRSVLASTVEQMVAEHTQGEMPREVGVKWFANKISGSNFFHCSVAIAYLSKPSMTPLMMPVPCLM